MNYGQLKETVAIRLGNRFDLLFPVPPATQAVIPYFIGDRIWFYQTQLFGESEQIDYSITTVPHKAIYPFDEYVNLAGVQSITNVRLLLNNVWIPLSRPPWYEDVLNADVQQPPFTTLPSYWVTYGRTLRLYPTPNLAYPLELMCNLLPPPPIDDTDENFWTNDAQTLIGAAAAVEICREFIKDDAGAARHAVAMNQARDAMMARDQRLAGPTEIRMHL